MALWAATEHAEVARRGTRSGDIGRAETEFQQFAHGCCPRRHAVLETEIVNGLKLFRREHDLQSFDAKIVHIALLPEAVRKA
jgi:hypothetical protein